MISSLGHASLTMVSFATFQPDTDAYLFLDVHQSSSEILHVTSFLLCVYYIWTTYCMTWDGDVCSFAYDLYVFVLSSDLTMKKWPL